MLTQDDIVGFFDRLRRDDRFVIGTDQYLAAFQVALTARRDDLRNRRSMGPFLAPIVCRSPDEQTHFRQRYDEWVRKREAEEAIDRSARRTIEQTTERSRVERLNRNRWWLYSFGGLFVAAALFFVVPPTIDLLDGTKTPPVLADKSIGNAGSPNPATSNSGTASLNLGGMLAWLIGGLLISTGCGLLYMLVRSEYLVRRKSRLAPEIEDVAITSTGDKVFHANNYERVRRELRRPREVARDRLDPVASADATVHQAGYFQPVYAARLAQPEYLILIDQLSVRDHFTILAQEIIDRLGINVTLYVFSGNPQFCFRRSGGHAMRSLHAMASRYSDYRLLVFTDMKRFSDPISGQIPDWLALFHEWPECAIFTPVEPRSWRFTERAIEDTGLPIFPLSEQGFAAYSGQFVLGSNGNRKIGWDPSSTSTNSPHTNFPPVLSRHSLRWIDYASPTEDEINQLERELGDYLGSDGSRWLAACAVYPEIHFDLTIDLGLQVLGVERSPEFYRSGLQKLMRLPWFRRGSMPDWLRLRLLDRIPSSRSRRIRRFLQTWQPSQEGRGTRARTIARSTTDRSLVARIRTLIRRGPSPGGGERPEQDHVFRVFMFPWTASSLAVGLPRALSRGLFQDREDFPGTQPTSDLPNTLAVAARGVMTRSPFVVIMAVIFFTGIFLTLLESVFGTIVLVIAALGIAVNLHSFAKDRAVWQVIDDDMESGET